jgi:hypothetical protein
MKMVNEYLAEAANFEKLATNEPNSKFREDLLRHARAYRRLAEERAKQLGITRPHSKGEAEPM